MKKEQLFEAMQGIDDELLDRSELKTGRRRKLWLAAACLCLIAAGAYVTTRSVPEIPNPESQSQVSIYQEGMEDIVPEQPPQERKPVEGPRYTWRAIYNEAAKTNGDAARVYIPGYFTQQLTEEDICAIEPGMRFEWMTYFGSAGFDGEGNLLEVVLNITTTLPDCTVTVFLSREPGYCAYLLPEELLTSVCYDVEYLIYQCQLDDRTLLQAEAVIEDVCFRFTVSGPTGQTDVLKADFEKILECFTFYSDEKRPDLSAVTPDTIPEWFDRKLTLSEAQADPDFGAYFLRVLPGGYREELIRRYKNQNLDYLFGLWTCGYNQISWHVSHLQEGDAVRRTSVTEIENYDLSLYPIPRAESVPDHLRQIVDDPIFDADELTQEAVLARTYRVSDAGDSDDYRMNFSVLFGDTVVSVSTKGVSPQWLYGRLMELKEQKS